MKDRMLRLLTRNFAMSLSPAWDMEQGRDGGDMSESWRLLPITTDDVDQLHALACQPLVYRYLFDGTAPSRELVADRVARATANVATDGLGMWVLTNQTASCAGCVELRPYPLSKSAEVTYLLDPDYWGQGLATRMVWTAISQAFRSPRIDCVVAGHDLPNTASRAVMCRLGMRFYRDVQYPLGAGAEYILHRNDSGPIPRPALIPLG